MEEWIDRMAGALNEEPISPREMGAVLKLARDVAHGVERRLAPLASYLAGVHVGRRSVEGASREDALTRTVDAALALIPPAEPGEGREAGHR